MTWAAYLRMRAELAEMRGLFTGKLRLGLPIFGSARLFAPLFATFRGRYPGVEIELLERGSVRLEEAVLAGEVELGVSLLPVADAFDVQPVCNDPLMALLWADHPLRDRERLRLAALEPSPFILFDHGFALNPRIEATCRARGFAPQVSARSSQMDFILALVASGMHDSRRGKERRQRTPYAGGDSPASASRKFFHNYRSLITKLMKMQGKK